MRYLEKSLWIVLVILLGGPALGYSQPFGGMTAAPQAVEKGKVLSSASGRFVFGQISDSSKDQFMLDTDTGRLWRVSETSDIGLHLRGVPYKASEGKYTPLPDIGIVPPGEGKKK